MRIGIDVESGERSFEEYVKGSFDAVQFLPNIQLFLIGNSTKIKRKFPEIEEKQNILLINANDVITMTEEPIKALKKKDSTIVIGINLLKNKVIDAFISPGNTGAIVASSVLNLGMMEGIKRPSMATFFPRRHGGETLILDIGANPESSELSLYQNAILGLSYYKLIWNKLKPKIGLLNVGGESVKGNSTVKKAYNFLNKFENFIGNVEGYNVFDGSVDIIVCNGFTGNSILKLAEALKKFFTDTLKKSFYKTKKKSFFKRVMLGIFVLSGFYADLKRNLIEALLPKYYGAAPLLGVNGLVLIGHGSSNYLDLINAINLAEKLNRIKYLEILSSNIKKILKND